MDAVRPPFNTLFSGADSFRARPIPVPNLSGATAVESPDGGFALVKALDGHFIASPDGDILIRAAHKVTPEGDLWHARGLALIFGVDLPSLCPVQLPSKVTVIKDQRAVNPPTDNPVFSNLE